MCGSSIVTSTSSPTWNGSARSSISARARRSRPPRRCRAAAPRRPRSGSACRSPPRARAARCRPRSSSRATFGLTRTRNASGSRLLRRPGRAGGAATCDRHRLLGLDDALAVAGRAALGEDLAHAVGDVLARHLDQAQRRDLHHVGLGLVLVERLAQRLQDLVAVRGPRHVDEVDDDDPADVAQAELAHDLLGRLDVHLRDRVLEPALAAAGEAAGVDVDHRQRLGVVDHQVAARGQVDAAREHRPVTPPRRPSRSNSGCAVLCTAPT